MTRRDARIMARRLRRHPLVLRAEAEWWGVDHGGWLVDLVTAHPPPYYPRPHQMAYIGAGTLYRPPRGHAAVLAWLGLSPGVPERPDMSPAHAADDAADYSTGGGARVSEPT